MIYRKSTIRGFGHSGEVTSPQMENRSYKGYSYRGITAEGIASILAEWEATKDWEYQGVPTFDTSYAIPISGIHYTEDIGEYPEGGRGPMTISLPSSTFVMTPKGGSGDMEILAWMAKQDQERNGLIGLPAKVRVYGAPYCEDDLGRRSDPDNNGECLAGRIIHSYKEVPAYRPARADIMWLFVVTRDIALVSRLCSMNPHAGVIYEPKEGWLTPSQMAGKAIVVTAVAAAVIGGMILLLRRG